MESPFFDDSDIDHCSLASYLKDKPLLARNIAIHYLVNGSEIPSEIQKLLSEHDQESIEGRSETDTFA